MKLICKFIIYITCIGTFSAVYAKKTLELTVDDTELFLVSGYTFSAQQGVQLLSFSPEYKTLKNTGIVASAQNATHMLLSHNDRRLYAIDESEHGRINQYYWRKSDKRFVYVRTYPNIGEFPSYLAYNPTAQQLAVTSSKSGNMKFIEVKPNNGLLSQIVSYQVKPSKNNSSSKQPDMQAIQWNRFNDIAYSVDKGTDRILMHHDDGFRFSTESAMHLLPNDSPRRIKFNPRKPVAYILNEESNTVVVADIDVEDGKLTGFQRVEVLPKKTKGLNQPSEMIFSDDGRFMYVTIRGVDLISVFEIQIDGSIRVIQHISTFGEWPQGMALSFNESHLIVVNQKSNNAVVFKRNQLTGELKRTHIDAKLSQPVFITAFNPQ